MKVFKRTISVYEGKQCKVEVEGKTVSVQWAFKNPEGGMVQAKGVMPLAVAAELALVLGDACALAGDVVNDTDLVVRGVCEICGKATSSKTSLRCPSHYQKSESWTEPGPITEEHR